MEIILNNINKIILGVLGVVGLVLVIKNIAAIRKFLTEVRVELGKVSWSNRQQLIGATSVVIVITGILTVYIGIVDLGLSRFLTYLIQ